tara:strand:+ start:2117 stop:2356 length:240 start_codon:yes stop_codon:yes gene_type:complete
MPKETQKTLPNYSVEIYVDNHILSLSFSSQEKAFCFFINSSKKIALNFIKNKTCYFSSSFYYKGKKLIEENTTLLFKEK